MIIKEKTIRLKDKIDFCLIIHRNTDTIIAVFFFTFSMYSMSEIRLNPNEKFPVDSSVPYDCDIRILSSPYNATFEGIFQLNSSNKI